MAKGDACAAKLSEVVLLIDRAAGRTYQAVAIAAEEDCNLEHIDACCLLGQAARPHYIVDGVERPDFDPTIPNDLRALGWFWHDGRLTWPPDATARVAIGMPVADLVEVWTKARAIAKVHADHQAAREAEEQR